MTGEREAAAAAEGGEMKEESWDGANLASTK